MSLLSADHYWGVNSENFNLKAELTSKPHPILSKVLRALCKDKACPKRITWKYLKHLPNGPGPGTTIRSVGTSGPGFLFLIVTLLGVVACWDSS